MVNQFLEKDSLHRSRCQHAFRAKMFAQRVTMTSKPKRQTQIDESKLNALENLRPSTSRPPSKSSVLVSHQQ
jgi:hypothetical protein